jgi:transposase
MEKLYSLGLDVDKASFKCCLKLKEGLARATTRATGNFSNSLVGFKEFHKWITKHRKYTDAAFKVVMEATGVYHEYLAAFLHDHDFAVHIILPLKAKRYFQSLGYKSKNDQIDAQALADLGLQQELQQWKPCAKNLLLLRSLTRQLQMLQENRTVFKNQLEAAQYLLHCDKLVIKNLKSLIRTIDKDIAGLKTRIDEFIQQDSTLSQKLKLFKSIKGLGIITFATLVAETGGFELFESQKQLVSYAGYDVVENQSGRRIGKTRISKQGNTHIRRIMHMASFNVVRYSVPPFYSLYNRVYDRSKTKMKGYVAVQRKLLCLIYALWKNDSEFNPDHGLQKTSGNQDPKTLFSVGPVGPEMKVATGFPVATLDGLPCNQSPEALFSVK